jgi:hypothetical protein
MYGERGGATTGAREVPDPPEEDAGGVGAWAAAIAALIAAIRWAIVSPCSVGSNCASVDAAGLASAAVEALDDVAVADVAVAVTVTVTVAVGLNGSSRAHAFVAKVHDTNRIAAIIPIIARRIGITIKPSSGLCRAVPCRAA